MFAIVFLAHFVVSNNLFEICFDFCMTLRNSSRFCLRMTFPFLSHALTYSAQSPTVRQRRRRRRTSFTIFVHSTVHPALTISLGLAHGVEASTASSSASNSMKCYFEQTLQFRNRELFDQSNDSRDVSCCKYGRATSVRIILLTSCLPRLTNSCENSSLQPV